MDTELKQSEVFESARKHGARNCNTADTEAVAVAMMMQEYESRGVYWFVVKGE